MGIVFVARGAGAWHVPDQDHLDLLPDQFAGQRVQTARVAAGVDNSIRDVLTLQPAEFMHALPEGRVEIGDSGFRSERQPADTSHGLARLSAADRRPGQQTYAG
jgi:hypothetical protein